MSDKIRVGKQSMFANTVPVKVVYDEIFESCEYPEKCLGDRFQILEIDGNYLVIQQMAFENKPSLETYKCFQLLGDAYSYLEMFGIDIEERKEYHND